MILFIKHISIEGPGLIGKFFENERRKREIIDLSRGDELPHDTKGINAVIVLGGPMNVYEEKKYPYLKAEDIFIKKVLDAKVPFLGLCLGAQLLAKASGAVVKKAEQEEIGFYKVDLTADGQKDRLFSGIQKEFDVFQWHGDTFDLPKKGKLLAASSTCRNQAFRVGENAYGLQFHLEVEGHNIKEWINEYFSCADTALRKKGQKMLNEYTLLKDNLEKNAEKLCRNFEKLLKPHCPKEPRLKGICD